MGGLQVTESDVLCHRDQQLSTSLHCCWDSKAGMTHVRPRLDWPSTPECSEYCENAP